MILVLAISGKKGHGKNEAVKQIRNIVGNKCVVVETALADPLKDEVARVIALESLGTATDVVKNEFNYTELYNMIRDELDHPVKKKQYRGMLQWWGTEFKRSRNKNYWLDQLQKRLDEIISSSNMDKPLIVCVTDPRFKNEMEYLVDNMDAVSLRVERYPAGLWGSFVKWWKLKTTKDHVSETDLDTWSFDIVVRNSGTKEQYQQALEKKLRPYLDTLLG